MSNLMTPPSRLQMLRHQVAAARKLRRYSRSKWSTTTTLAAAAKKHHTETNDSQ